jgi:hypothetical protein
MIDCVMEFLSAENGGAVYCNATEVDVSINGSSFISCSASISGGGCFSH